MECCEATETVELVRVKDYSGVVENLWLVLCDHGPSSAMRSPHTRPNTKLIFKFVGRK